MLRSGGGARERAGISAGRAEGRHLKCVPDHWRRGRGRLEKGRRPGRCAPGRGHAVGGPPVAGSRREVRGGGGRCRRAPAVVSPVPRSSGSRSRREEPGDGGECEGRRGRGPAAAPGRRCRPRRPRRGVRVLRGPEAARAGGRLVGWCGGDQIHLCSSQAWGRWTFHDGSGASLARAPRPRRPRPDAAPGGAGGDARGRTGEEEAGPDLVLGAAPLRIDTASDLALEECSRTARHPLEVRRAAGSSRPARRRPRAAPAWSGPGRAAAARGEVWAVGVRRCRSARLDSGTARRAPPTPVRPCRAPPEAAGRACHRPGPRTSPVAVRALEARGRAGRARGED